MHHFQDYVENLELIQKRAHLMGIVKILIQESIIKNHLPIIMKNLIIIC